MVGKHIATLFLPERKKILYFTIAQLNIIDNMKEIILDNFGLFLNISRLYQFNLWWTLLNKRI